jgi:hypothetical protein
MLFTEHWITRLNWSQTETWTIQNHCWSTEKSSHWRRIGQWEKVTYIHLVRKISLVIQKGHCSNIMNTLPSGKMLDKVFYITKIKWIIYYKWIMKNTILMVNLTCFTFIFFSSIVWFSNVGRYLPFCFLFFTELSLNNWRKFSNWWKIKKINFIWVPSKIYKINSNSTDCETCHNFSSLLFQFYCN